MFTGRKNDQPYCGLDLGENAVKAAVIRRRDTGGSELLGVYESPTVGFGRSSVTDIGALTECLHNVLTQLMKKTGLKWKDVVLGMGGALVDQRRSASVIPLCDRGNKVISATDVRKLENQTRLLGANLEESVLHDFPQHFKVDDANTASNPVGLYGRKLELEMLVIVAGHGMVKNLTKAVNQAGFDVTAVAYSGIAAAECSLDEAQKKAGVLYVDIGVATTGLLIYRDGRLQYFGSLRSGGGRMTDKLAERLGLSDELAEEIKKSYAFVHRTDSASEEEVLIHKDGGYVPVKKEAIFQAVDPVAQEFLGRLRQRVNESGLSTRLNAGLVLGGGGGLMAGLAERLEEHLRRPVGFGRIRFLDKKMYQSGKFAAAVGLAEMALRRACRDRDRNGNRTAGLKGFTTRMVELYQEYF